MIPAPERVFRGKEHWMVWFAVGDTPGWSSTYRGIVIQRTLKLVMAPV